MFKIPAAVGEPVHFQKMPHIRFGSSLTDLRNYPQYIKAIYNSQDDWSAKVIENATIDDLDKDAISLAREKFKEKMVGKPFFDDIDRWSDETFLDKAKITINGQISNTAIILLERPNPHIIFCQVWHRLPGNSIPKKKHMSILKYRCSFP